MAHALFSDPKVSFVFYPGDDLYGASAWREGQKLVQKILGPSPISLRKRRVCEHQEFLQRGNLVTFLCLIKHCQLDLLLRTGHIQAYSHT